MRERWLGRRGKAMAYGDELPNRDRARWAWAEVQNATTARSRCARCTVCVTWSRKAYSRRRVAVTTVRLATPGVASPTMAPEGRAVCRVPPPAATPHPLSPSSSPVPPPAPPPAVAVALPPPAPPPAVAVAPPPPITPTRLSPSPHPHPHPHPPPAVAPPASPAPTAGPPRSQPRAAVSGSAAAPP
jgi:hypothetical protein